MPFFYFSVSSLRQIEHYCWSTQLSYRSCNGWNSQGQYPCSERRHSSYSTTSHGCRHDGPAVSWGQSNEIFRYLRKKKKKKHLFHEIFQHFSNFETKSKYSKEIILSVDWASYYFEFLSTAFDLFLRLSPIISHLTVIYFFFLTMPKIMRIAPMSYFAKFRSGTLN